MKKASLIIFVLLLFNSVIFAQNAQIRGKVVDTNGEPMVGATVMIPAIEAGAYTNEEGIFSLDKLAGGEYQLIAFYIGYDTAYQKVTIGNGKVMTIQFGLKEVGITGAEVEITATRETGKIETTELKSNVTAITPEQIKIIPSVGSPDLAQYLQLLPGVVFTGDQGGQLYIRGGTPIQNMVLLDGMIIYSPFHSLGLFSVFDLDYIRSTDVYTAAFPAKYGGRTSSVMDIRTRNGNLNKFHVRWNANPFSAGALLEGPLLKGKRQGSGVSFMLSAKNNYIDKTSGILYPYVKPPLDAKVALPYNYMDTYGKITATDGINYVNVFGFNHNDNVNYQTPANINWQASGGGANFQLLPTQAAVILSGNFAYSDYRTKLETQSETFARKSNISGFNGGLNMTYILNKVNQLDFGLTVFGFNTNYRFTNSFGYATTQEKSNSEAAFYIGYKHVFLAKNVSYSERFDKAFERLVLEPSVRLHYYNDQGYFSPEPRLRGKLNFNRVSFNLGTGLYAQNLLSAQSDRDIVNIFQGFLSAPEPGALLNQKYDHSMQRAFHLTAGAEFEIMKYLSTNIEGWSKTFMQLANINRDKIFPNEKDFLAETGRAFGVDMILKYQTPTLYLYGTYGWAKVQRNDGKQTYYPVFDRRHTVNLVAAYKLGRFEYATEDGKAVRSRFNEAKWEFSSRFTLGSGFPFTQTQGYYEELNFTGYGSQTNYVNQNGNLGIILSSDLNAGRLPYYHRLDLSVKRRWVFNNKTMLELNTSLINTYNRKNIFYFDRIRYIPVYQLPVLPSIGISMIY
ncbi:MAG: TonB-dependent receptor [Bacteroidia bacterium]